MPCRVSHEFISFEARRHHYDHLISPPTQSRPKGRKYNQILENLSLEQWRLLCSTNSAGLYMVSMSHWGIIHLSSFCLLQTVLLSSQVTPLQKVSCCHSAKAKMSPFGWSAQEVFGCSWCSLCPCQQAGDSPETKVTDCSAHRPGTPHTFFPHLQQFPWFKTAPLGHSDISKVPKHWQEGDPGTTELFQNLLSRELSSLSRRFMRLLF